MSNTNQLVNNFENSNNGCFVCSSRSGGLI